MFARLDVPYSQGRKPDKMPIVILMIKGLNSVFIANTYLLSREGTLFLFERSISLY